MKTEVTVDLSQFGPLLQGAAAVPAGLTFEEPLGVVSVLLESEAKLAFHEQRGPDGVPWAPFKRKPSKRRGGWSAKLLRDRDILMASMTAHAAAGAIREVHPRELTQGTAVEYGIYHQAGTRNMEARPFAGVSAEAEGDIDEIIGEYAAGKVAEGFAG